LVEVHFIRWIEIYPVDKHATFEQLEPENKKLTFRGLVLLKSESRDYAMTYTGRNSVVLWGIRVPTSRHSYSKFYGFSCE